MSLQSVRVDRKGEKMRCVKCFRLFLHANEVLDSESRSDINKVHVICPCPLTSAE